MKVNVALAYLTIFGLAHALYISKRILQRQGPLYESVGTLINFQSIYAAEIWNNTKLEVDEHTYLLDDAINMTDYYQMIVNEKLEIIFSMAEINEFRKCFKQYERQIAHFNRQLLSKYNVCKTSLIHIKEDLKLKIASEADFISKAAEDVLAIGEICQIYKLKKRTSNQAGVLMCVLTRIGSINQHLTDSMELCMDTLLELTMNSTEYGQVHTESCRSYTELKQQFDELYANIQICENQLKENVSTIRNYTLNDI